MELDQIEVLNIKCQQALAGEMSSPDKSDESDREDQLKNMQTLLSCKKESKAKSNKEAIWLYAALFSVITITDSHDKIYTTSGLFFPIEPKVW